MIKRAPAKLKSHSKKKIDIFSIVWWVYRSQSRQKQFDSLWMPIWIGFNANSPPNQNDRPMEQNWHRAIHTTDFGDVQFYCSAHPRYKSRTHKRWTYLFRIDFLDDLILKVNCANKENAQIQMYLRFQMSKTNRNMNSFPILWNKN